MENWEKKYNEEGRFLKAKKALDNLMTDRGLDVKRIPVMLTVRDIQMIFFMHYRPALRFIHKNLAPGVVKVGKRLLIHQWAVHRLLNMVGRCPQCGRHWDDKLVLQELQENGQKAEEVPQFSTGGLRGGLDCREALNELREEGSEKVTLKDVSGKGLPRPKKKRTDPRDYEEALKDLWEGVATGDDDA